MIEKNLMNTKTETKEKIKDLYHNKQTKEIIDLDISLKENIDKSVFNKNSNKQKTLVKKI